MYYLSHVIFVKNPAHTKGLTDHKNALYYFFQCTRIIKMETEVDYINCCMQHLQQLINNNNKKNKVFSNMAELVCLEEEFNK